MNNPELSAEAAPPYWDGTPAEPGDSGPPQNGQAALTDSAPWTDSDLQELEDAPLPTAADRAAQSPGPMSIGQASPAPAEDVWADTDIPYQPKELGVVDQLLLLLADAAALWKKGLRWVRSQLPTDLQRQLSDEILTAIALGLLMLLLALWNPLGARSGERLVASEPLPEPLPRITAAAPEPTPTALPEPTPEQSLIADIQDRVSRISQSYGVGLIQSVEVNLPASTLGVNVAEAWYGLLASQQDAVAQDIYSQAQGLTFGTLQLRDPAGRVVARNPVVGPTMVILHRLRSPDLPDLP